MSRIGRQLIDIPNAVTVSFSDGVALVSGPKGSLKYKLPEQVSMEASDGKVKMSGTGEEVSRFLGLARSLVANMITGVNTGWTKTLELSGTGYRANTDGAELQLNLGFSHPVKVVAPAGIKFEVKENKITVSGADKEMVGRIAATTRALRPADPYKLKGFKYLGEVIIKKAGKAAKAGGAK